MDECYMICTPTGVEIEVCGSVDSTLKGTTPNGEQRVDLFYDNGQWCIYQTVNGNFIPVQCWTGPARMPAGDYGNGWEVKHLDSGNGLGENSGGSDRPSGGGGPSGGGSSMGSPKSSGSISESSKSGGSPSSSPSSSIGSESASASNSASSEAEESSSEESPSSDEGQVTSTDNLSSTSE